MSTSDPSTPPPPPSSPLLALPAEIREQIYTHLLRPANCKIPASPSTTTSSSPSPTSPTSPTSSPPALSTSDLPFTLTGPHYSFPLHLLLVSHLLYDEATPVFRRLNKFVKISTPWPEAIRHINGEGSVGTVLTGGRATDFQGFHLRVLISTALSAEGMLVADGNAGGGGGDGGGGGAGGGLRNYDMITHVDELEAFVRIWQFSHLNSTRQLNPHLVLRCDLKDPWCDSDSERRLEKGLQKRLLGPFGRVKELHKMLFDFHGRAFFATGEVDQGVKEAVVSEQEAPELTPEERVAECVRLATEGEGCVERGEYGGALERFYEAFEAVHIFHSEGGKKREVHCDSYYTVEMKSGDFAGQFGHYVRIMLRIQLVAKVMEVLLKMKRSEDALFWGRRSILTFKSSISSVTSEDGDEIGAAELAVEDSPMFDRQCLVDKHWDAFLKQAAEMHFAGKADMGLIFYRTAIAGREVRKRDDGEVEACMNGAAVFRPNDKIIGTEVNAMKLRMFAMRDDLVECVNRGPG